MNSNLKVKKTKEFATLPKRATEGSAGFDLFAAIEKSIDILPGEISMVPTGIAISIDNPSYFGMICARSGLSIKHGITLANGVGVIDSDYRGEIFIGLHNISNKTYTITPNQRIAQLIIVPISYTGITEITHLDETERGQGGFGSTGK